MIGSILPMSTECSQNNWGRSIRVSGVVSFRASTPAPVLEAPMKEIRLTQGKVALVDDEDYEWLNQWKWNAYRPKGVTWYAKRCVRDSESRRNINVLMHRVIMGLCHGNPLTVDHIDGNGLNNQQSNLRVCTLAQNVRNRHVVIGKSKYRGVCLCSGRLGKRPWRASINTGGKNLWLGKYATEEEAAVAYNGAALEYFGRFANLNMVELDDGVLK